MPLIQKPNYNQIFASQAPDIDKPAVFNNYPEGWGPESRPNNGKPTIKGFNYLQQTSDLKDLWILQNGACLPYDESIEYADGAPVLKDGVIQYKTASGWVDVNNALSSVKDLAWVLKIAGISFFVKSYRPGIGLGGGHFVWDTFGDKAKHNGGTIIDPDRPLPSDWSNNTQVAAWFTAGTGTGVWRRIYSGEVNAEDFGFVSDDTYDSQLIVQHIVDKVSSSNIPVTFRNGVAMISKSGITVKTGLNATLDNFKFKAMSGYGTYDCVFKFTGCEKANIYFKGDSVVEMPQDEYTTGEWRHAFDFNGGSNIEVFYPKVNGTGGDAYYIANNTNIKLHKPVSLRSRRQGMSVISVNGLRVYNPEFHNTIGTTPQSGLCIEPGSWLNVLKDIIIESPVCINSGGCGIGIYLEKFSSADYSGEPIEITINNPVTRGSAESGILIQRVYNDTVKYGGYININNPVSYKDRQGGIYVSGKDKDCAVVNISNPVIVDACENGTNYATKSAVLIVDFGALPVDTGGINITDIVTTDKNSKVDFAVNFDLSSGISDSTVTLASWEGATTAPIGFGSSVDIDPAKAELSTIVFKTTKELTDKAYAAGFITTKDSYSNVITNTGSGFDITIQLRWYPPKSIPLKFAVKTEKLMTIKPLDTTDKIIGTSAAGQGIHSNIVGATAEIYYFGLINGVRLWRFVGDRDLWTFE